LSKSVIHDKYFDKYKNRKKCTPKSVLCWEFASVYMVYLMVGITNLAMFSARYS